MILKILFLYICEGFLFSFNLAYQNILLGKPVSFQPYQIASGLPQDVNDGNPSTCMASSTILLLDSRWFADFEEYRDVKEVNITLSSSESVRRAMIGFSISVSNTSSYNEGTECYYWADSDTVPPEIASYPCVGTGRYLFVWNRHKKATLISPSTSQMTLCEVSLTGCAIGRYGTDCENNCSVCNNCDYETGSCPNKCVSSMYGENCDKKCAKCKDGLPCNRITGVCDVGCATGYLPPYCGQENILSGLSANYIWQGNVITGQGPNNLLTDGSLSSCVLGNHPLNQNTIGSVSSVFTLGQYRVIKEITINFDATAALSTYSGFSIILKNGTSEQLCYQWTLASAPLASDTYKCEGNASEIIIRNVREANTVTLNPTWGSMANLGICEVSSPGCPAGKYGTSCELDCSCLFCDYVTGFCPNLNQDCSNGTYGTNCMETCGNCSNNDVCNPVSGVCPNGCIPGYNGSLCKMVCSSGTYGQNCSSSCGNCKDSVTCHHVDGSCPTGCAPGYRGSDCKQVCPTGTYGAECSQTCGACKDGETCHHVTGNCVLGCASGYIGANCKSGCGFGMYGLNCSMTCRGVCENNATCHPQTGQCASCPPGFRGLYCTEECQLGFYGSNCLQQCSVCINRTCNAVNGSCLYGVQKGLNAGSVALSTNDLATIICLVFASVGLIVAVTMIFIAYRAHQRIRREMEEPNTQEKQKKQKPPKSKAVEAKRKSQNSRLPTTNIETVLQAEGERQLLPDEGLYFGVDDTPHKGDDYYNASVFATGIQVSQLKDHIKNKRVVIEDEFKELQKGAIHPCKAATQPENKPKNRYLTVLPYDHSIVELTPIPGKPDTNYINGNYIDSTKKEKAYIATQGPMTSTIGDFWRLVWQTCSGKIVMLTNLKEKNKMKCAQYWPNKGETIEFGVFKIAVQAEKKHITYVERALRIEDTTSGECRIVQHFHYISWPDHGTPDHVQLVMFHQHVLAVHTELIGPLIVHCSAGIGRTGTFIALDSLLEQAKTTNQVQIFNFVKYMRKDRMNMIQTVDQYLYVYHTLYEALNIRQSEIKRKAFAKEYLKLEDKNAPQDGKRTVKEFKLLDEMRGVFEADMLSPKPKRKAVKNTSSALLEKVPTNKIPRYGGNQGYLLVQSLLPTMNADLWKMMMTKESSVLVSLDKQSSDFLGSFLPPVGETRVSDNIQILNSTSVKNDIANAEVISLDITNKATEQSNEITVIKGCNNGKLKMTPEEMAHLITVIDQTNTDNYLSGSTTVLSSDGVSSPGLLCAVSNAIQDASLERVIDLFHTVRQLHIRNPKFIANQEDYDFCYQAVYEFLMTDSDYANLANENEQS